MKHARIGAGLALTGALLLAAAAPAVLADTAALHRQGAFMADADQRVVLLHGVNAVWKPAPYYPPATAAGFTAADADFLAANGFNAVRLGVLFAGVMPRPGLVDTAYLDQIDRVVKLLAARHIWVLLDFHQDQLDEAFQGEGFPAWAVDDGGLPDDARYGFPLDEFLSLALNAAYDNLWRDKNGVWAQYRAAWAAVAARWRDQPYLLGYDLFNEPWPGTQWPSCFEIDCPLFDATLQKFQQQALSGVRSADPGHLAFFEPQQLFDFGAPSHFGAVADANLGLSWHAYCSANLLSPQGLPEGPDCPIVEPRTMANAARQSAAMGATSLISEFGASDDLKDIARVTALADSHLVGWTYWAYKTWADPTGSGQAESLFADDGDLASLKPAKADLLIRPYARAVAGIPLATSFDPASKAFALTFAPRPAGAPTEIFVPARHYPNGYKVSVQNGQVVSAPGARLLLILARPGAAVVSVQLVPAT